MDNVEFVRLQKYLAENGVASRRKAEELILEGRVEVNGKKVMEMGIKVSPHDIVMVDGQVVSEISNKIYIMLNKPKGYVSTAKDQFGRVTVLDLVKDIKQRVYPVGRLDYDTTGLLLMTNDGDLTFKLTHPSHEVSKTYEAEIKGLPSQIELSQFEAGLNIDDYITSPAKIKILVKKAASTLVRVTIHEGKNRQVRKMCEAIGHSVINLKRVSVGDMRLGELAEGKWRYLTPNEVEQLFIYFAKNILHSD